ncbi:hypothetical protein DFP72DRAFT_1052469 [Ephemerocybe angulata]|uniref:Uncharacterized protein n=1 Tax=Ephemerocybe angulata TaxID=980116 RepID=A0A8H6HCG3_9AGAR|nr:hypothetical protein DFP72DRAFT_1052469 [Tulosesus angulatus]
MLTAAFARFSLLAQTVEESSTAEEQTSALGCAWPAADAPATAGVLALVVVWHHPRGKRPNPGPTFLPFFPHPRRTMAHPRGPAPTYPSKEFKRTTLKWPLSRCAKHLGVGIAEGSYELDVGDVEAEKEKEKRASKRGFKGRRLGGGEAGGVKVRKEEEEARGTGGTADMAQAPKTLLVSAPSLLERCWWGQPGADPTAPRSSPATARLSPWSDRARLLADLLTIEVHVPHPETQSTDGHPGILPECSNGK